MAVSAFAPAKVNLYLHVVGRRDDGHHLLDSLIAFADIGDRITAMPADELSLTLAGPQAGALADADDDNLVLRAARLLAVAVGNSASGAALRLEKHLPVSSGIGGGSSDAAATLHALCRLWNCRPDATLLKAIALQLGADVPACLAARPVWVGGVGERLEDACGLPPSGIVLANPRRALSTPAVFKARRGAFSRPARFEPMPRDAAGLAETLCDRRNDLTEAALSLVPEIAPVLDALAWLPGALLARMSGSGATCFALFADRAAAEAAGSMLARAEPSWWVGSGALLTGPPEIGGNGEPISG